jgi:stress response protein YsnF
LQSTITAEQILELRGTPVYASDGAKLGHVEEVFVDVDTEAPEWIGIGTGFFGTKRVLVPAAGASLDPDAVTVPYAKDQVKDSPDIDSDEISQETERELYSYYGLGYSEQRSDTGLPEGSVDVDRERGEAVVRSEEELKVGKRTVEAGRARLRKWVETEQVEEDVDLRRETAHVTREPIDRPVSGAEIGEDEVEISLHKEEAVVQKEVVAKERIGLEKGVESETVTVSDEVRKERVEVEGEVDGGVEQDVRRR